jgi:hypothetical protein
MDRGGPLREDDIDWDDVQRRLRGALLAELGRHDQDVLKDLVQEGSILVLRKVRQEGAQNIHGLISVAAHWIALGEIRRLQRWRALFEWLGDSVVDSTAPSRDEFDEITLRLFALAEFYSRHRPLCRDLLEAYLELGDWEAVAVRMRKSYEATRQDKSRCRQLARAAYQRDPDIFDSRLPDE